jgi:hypothetical protein
MPTRAEYFEKFGQFVAKQLKLYCAGSCETWSLDMYSKLKIQLMFILSIMIGCACRSQDASEVSDIGPGAEMMLSVKNISDLNVFNDLATDGGGLVAGGKAVKFLIDNRVVGQKNIYFINANFQSAGSVPEYAKYHFYFAKKQLQIPGTGDDFNQDTYFEKTKKFYAGTVRSYQISSNSPEIYGFQFYPQDIISEEEVLDAVTTVNSAFNVPGAKAAFVATGSQQTTVKIQSQLASLGLENLSIDKILGSINFIPMHLGESWGYLRIFPRDLEALEPTDIPVFEELPLDLSVVAGVITKSFQDSNSHINLKSKERNTPNMVLRDASLTNPDLAKWANLPVHIKVTAAGYKIEASSPQEVSEKLRQRTDHPWVALQWKSTTNILSYDAVCPSAPNACLTYSAYIGSKAANLGFLAHSKVLGRKQTPGTFSAKLGYDLTPLGFGIPLQFYQDFVDNPQNAILKSKIADFVAKERAGELAPAMRTSLTLAIQELFYKGAFPSERLAAITAALNSTVPGIKKFKVRSSANAEDLPNFDGAGLYTSFSVNLEKLDNPDGSCAAVWKEEDGERELEMSPKTMQCGIKGVYASLWNRRAVEERSFARIEHSSVAMGIAVVPKYSNESEVIANSVVVTRVINASDIYGYTLSVQRDNNLVTNPLPGTYSELTIAGFTADTEPLSLTVTRFAKPVANGPTLTAPVLDKPTMAMMVDISRTVERAYCRYKPGYYNGACEDVTWDLDKPKSLDLEMKYLANHQFVCKQVREFSGK